MAQRQPTPQDQLMLELINRARANPQEEANRYLNGLLNEGVSSADTISTQSKQPLAFNLNLNDGAKNHSQWMLDNNVFSHTGQGGSTSRQRMEDAGYQFVPSWGSGENIAWKGNTRSVNFTGFVIDNYEALFIDEDYPNRGHRVNMLNPDFQEIGISSLQGQFTVDNVTYNSVMTTQDFAYSNNVNAFLTGVVYNDNVINDDFYTIGEGISDIEITATDITDSSKVFTTTNFETGGYSLALPEGTYNITFIGNLDFDPQDDIVRTSATINNENVKLDVVTDSLELEPPLPQQQLEVESTPTSESTPESTTPPESTPNPNPTPNSNNDSLLNSAIYRFQNNNVVGTYLYAGELESQNIRNNFSQFQEEGFAFFVGVEANDDLIPMYRFQNSDIPGTYLYAGESESQNIRQNFPNFIEEGIAFYVYGGGSNQGESLYRFQNLNQLGTYIFVTEAERRNILQNFPSFQEEGIAFNVET